jgi:hypothetical protein
MVLYPHDSRLKFLSFWHYVLGQQREGAQCWLLRHSRWNMFRIAIVSLFGFVLLSRSSVAIYHLRCNATHDCIATTLTDIVDWWEERVMGGCRERYWLVVCFCCKASCMMRDDVLAAKVQSAVRGWSKGVHVDRKDAQASHIVSYKISRVCCMITRTMGKMRERAGQVERRDGGEVAHVCQGARTASQARASELMASRRSRLQWVFVAFQQPPVAPSPTRPAAHDPKSEPSPCPHLGPDHLQDVPVD